MGVISSEESKIFYGRGAGKALDKALSLAENRVWIAASKIDERNIRKLVGKKKEDDIDLKIVVEEENDENKLLKSLLGIEETNEHTFLYDYRYLFLAATIISVLGVGLSLTYNKEMAYLPIAIAVVSSGLLAISYFLTTENQGAGGYDDLFFQDADSHITNSRIYILDDKVFVGSVDLTDSSLWKDREVLFQLISKDTKESIEMMFNGIVNEKRNIENDMEIY